MAILIACEESQVVCEAFRKLGHEAYSCDILPTSGNHPEWHIQGDVLGQINKGWDLMIAFPPCTYFAVAGLQYLKTQPGRLEKQVDAARFVKKLWECDIPKICIENPVGQLPRYIGKYSQIVRMWQFGHEDAHKPTCFWLKGLPLLKPTDIVKPLKSRKYPNGKVLSQWRARNASAKDRSKTFSGIAQAMAEQWSKLL